MSRHYNFKCIASRGKLDKALHYNFLTPFFIIQFVSWKIMLKIFNFLSFIHFEKLLFIYICFASLGLNYIIIFLTERARKLNRKSYGMIICAIFFSYEIKNLYFGTILQRGRRGSVRHKCNFRPMLTSF